MMHYFFFKVMITVSLPSCLMMIYPSSQPPSIYLFSGKPVLVFLSFVPGSHDGWVLVRLRVLSRWNDGSSCICLWIHARWLLEF